MDEALIEEIDDTDAGATSLLRAYTPHASARGGEEDEGDMFEIFDD